MNKKFPRFRPTCFLWLAVILSTFAATARADVRFSPLFGEAMVLQRDRSVRVWGEASPNEPVTVGIAEKTAETVADRNGIWSVMLEPLPAGGPYTLTAAGRKNEVTLNDVLVGEVWLCVGAELMNRTVADAELEKEGPLVAAPNVRYFRLEPVCAEKRKTMVRGRWSLATVKDAPEFSAVAMTFAQELNRRLDVPVGVIVAAYDRSTSEAWCDPVSFSETPLLEPLAEPGRNQIKPPEQRAGSLWFGTLAPLTRLTLRGAVFDGGAMNSGRAYQYRTLFETMIQQWRTAWGVGDFPFYYIGLEAFPTERDGRTQSAAAELREAQRRAESLRRVRGVVTVDLGRLPSPRKIGERLAALAAWDEYRIDDIGTGPTLREMTIEGDHAHLIFDSVGGGLTASDGGPISGFFLAENEGEFLPADVTIEGNRLTLSSKFITRPAAVRYGWADGGIGNFQNNEGFPAPPFRTDNRPGVTEYGR